MASGHLALALALWASKGARSEAIYSTLSALGHLTYRRRTTKRTKAKSKESDSRLVDGSKGQFIALSTNCSTCYDWLCLLQWNFRFLCKSHFNGQPLARAKLALVLLSLREPINPLNSAPLVPLSSHFTLKL